MFYATVPRIVPSYRSGRITRWAITSDEIVRSAPGYLGIFHRPTDQQPESGEGATSRSVLFTVDILCTLMAENQGSTKPFLAAGASLDIVLVLNLQSYLPENVTQWKGSDGNN